MNKRPPEHEDLFGNCDTSSVFNENPAKIYRS